MGVNPPASRAPASGAAASGLPASAGVGPEGVTAVVGAEHASAKAARARAKQPIEPARAPLSTGPLRRSPEPRIAQVAQTHRTRGYAWAVRHGPQIGLALAALAC